MVWCYDLNGNFVSGCSQSQFCPSHYQNNLVLSLSPLPVPQFPFLILQKSSPRYKEGSLNTVQRSKLPSRAEEISFGRMPLLGTGQNKHMEKGSEWGMLCLGRLVHGEESCKTGFSTAVHCCLTCPGETWVLPHFWTFLWTAFIKRTLQGPSSFPIFPSTPFFLLSILHSAKQNLQ